MADEDDWFGGGDDDAAPAALKPLGKKKDEEEEAAAEGEAPAADGEDAPPQEGAPAEGEFDEDFLDPDRLLLFKHWIRPKFLPYKCLYDYRRSYYDDIMEVLNSRRKGIRRSIPPAQTWAERYCRARSDPLHKVDSFNRYLEDVKLVTKTEISGNLYKYYSREQFNRRFAPLLY